MHRILSAEISMESFAYPTDFDLEKYDDDGRFGYGDGTRIRLSFRVDRDAGLHLLESPLSTDQKVVTLPDGRLEITTTVVDSDMLDWWLRGFGGAVSDIEKLGMA